MAALEEIQPNTNTAMKTCYYVILYRPKGSSTWTPYGKSVCACNNFFASRSLAERTISDFVQAGETTYLPGPKHRVPIEFTIGQVTINDDTPVGVSGEEYSIRG